MQKGCAMSRSAMHDSVWWWAVCCTCERFAGYVMQGVPACCRGDAGYQQGHDVCAAETPGCWGCISGRGNPITCLLGVLS